MKQIGGDVKRKRTLSYAGRPKQRHKVRIAQKRLHVMYLTLSADKARRPGRQVVALNRCDEAVTLSRDGLDGSRRKRIVTQRLTDFGDARLENRIADMDARPNGPEEFVFRGKPPGTLGQVRQDCQRFGC